MKKLLSMILTMLMLLSVICIAPVSVSATEVEVAQTGVTMTGGEVLYFIPSSNWKVENARFAAYFYGSGNAWVSCTEVEGEDNLYSVTVPAGSWTNVIFCRMNPYSATNDWNNKWNQSADLTFDGTNNCWANVEGSWDGSQGTWSVYTPTVVEPEPQPETITVYFADTRNWGGCSPMYMGYDRIFLESTYVETNENGIDIYSFDVSFYDYEYGSAGIAIFAFPEETDFIDLDMLYDGACIYVTDEIAFDYGENIAYRVTISPYVPTPTPEPDPEPEVPADPKTVYFVDYADNFTEVYAYAWSVTTKPESTDDEVSEIAAEWPGVKMTATGEALSENAKQAGGLVYSVTFDKAYDYIIFSGTDADGASMGQTADLTFEADKYCYWGNEAWYDSIADIESDFPVTDDNATVTIFFQNNWMWTDINIYCWDADYNYIDYSWPGTSMAYYDNDGTYDIYSFNLPTNVAGFLISGIKDDGSGALDKTPDITDGFYDGICYYMKWDNGNTVGSNDISVVLPDNGGSEDEGGAEAECEHEYNSNGVCYKCATLQQGVIAGVYGTSLTLGGKIGVNLYVAISEEIINDDSAKIVMSVPNSGSTTEVIVPASEFEFNEANNTYKFTCEVAAKEMTAAVSIAVKTDTTELVLGSYAVKDYCMSVLGGSFASEQLREVARTMLNYGAAAQVYFDYNIDNLANKDMSEEDKVVTVYDHSDYEVVKEGEAGIIEFVGASLVLESDTYIKFYFKVDETQLPEGVTPAITINGLRGATLEKNGNLWFIAMPSLAAHEYSTEFVLELGNGYTVTYSANSYIYAAQNSTKAELVNLANALGAYSNATGIYGSN